MGKAGAQPVESKGNPLQNDSKAIVAIEIMVLVLCIRALCD